MQSHCKNNSVLPNCFHCSLTNFSSYVIWLSWFLIAMSASNPYQHINQSSDGVMIEMDLLQVGSEPVGMRCPYCYEDVMTRAVYINSKLTHVVALVLGILFWWLCCCLIPYATRKWKDVKHYCPTCHRYLGVYTRRRII